MTVLGKRIAMGSEGRTALAYPVVPTLRTEGFQLEPHSALTSEPQR